MRKAWIAIVVVCLGWGQFAAAQWNRHEIRPPAPGKPGLSDRSLSGPPRPRPEARLPEPEPALVSVGSELKVFRDRVDEAFLEAGLNMTISIDDGGGLVSMARRFDQTDGLPALVVWGYLSRPTVYAIVTKLNLLNTAKAQGFRMVYFWDKADGAKWFFKLQGATSCSRDLCFAL